MLITIVQPSVSYIFFIVFSILVYHRTLSIVPCALQYGKSVVKNLPAKQEIWVWFLSQEDPLENEMATHSNILVWETPQTEEPGGLQSMRSKGVRLDLVSEQQQKQLHSRNLFFLHSIYTSLEKYAFFLQFSHHECYYSTSQ